VGVEQVGQAIRPLGYPAEHAPLFDVRDEAHERRLRHEARLEDVLGPALEGQAESSGRRVRTHRSGRLGSPLGQVYDLNVRAVARNPSRPLPGRDGDVPAQLLGPVSARGASSLARSAGGRETGGTGSLGHSRQSTSAAAMAADTTIAMLRTRSDALDRGMPPLLRCRRVYSGHNGCHLLRAMGRSSVS